MTETVTALVLAAPRQPGVNPLSAVADVSHKCLVKANGVAMIERVIDSLLAAERVGRILVSIDDAAVLDRVPAVAALRREGRVEAVASRGNLFASVASAVEEASPAVYPLLVTTADSALQTGEIVDDFLRRVQAAGADAAFAMTPEEVIAQAYPGEPRLAIHRLADGGYSTCNLYALTGPAALKAAAVMKTGGQFRKSKWRVLKAFGLINMLRYRFGLISLEGIGRAVSRRFGLKVAAISLPFADAAIDADSERSFAIVERALQRREGGG